MRSYAGTAVNSDHRIVITDMNIAPYYLFQNKKHQKHEAIYSSKLHDPALREQYQTKINECLCNISIEDGNVQQKWDMVTQFISTTAKEILGLKTSSRNNRVYDAEIEILSKQQKNVRNQISCCDDIDKATMLKAERNKILHTITSKTLANREAEIDQIPDHTKNV